jgi:hypothetical protein
VKVYVCEKHNYHQTLIKRGFLCSSIKAPGIFLFDVVIHFKHPHYVGYAFSTSLLDIAYRMTKEQASYMSITASLLGELIPSAKPKTTTIHDHLYRPFKATIIQYIQIVECVSSFRVTKKIKDDFGISKVVCPACTGSHEGHKGPVIMVILV